jgi:hypothetical protein
MTNPFAPKLDLWQVRCPECLELLCAETVADLVAYRAEHDARWHPEQVAE